MPIPQVAVDVVGEYCYTLKSANPQGGRDYEVPVIVDVALVGRTKVREIQALSPELVK